MYFPAFFQGTSSAPTVAAADMVEQCPSAVPESVWQTDITSMQVHIEEAAVTPARRKGKMSGKRMIQNPMLSFYKHNIQVYNPGFFFCSYSFMKSNIDPLVITPVY